jgi:glutamyl-tRNA synthetase
MEIKDLAYKYALQNAVKFSGRANQGAVIGKIISEMPDAKASLKTLGKEIAAIITQVNSMKPDEQLSKLQEIAPELLQKKEKEEHDLFAHIPIPGPVVAGFPPEPSKYPHIGHAKAILLNYELARRNKGKFILRFEDTNPKLAKKEFYDVHIEDYRWLGVEPDETIYVSDHMEQLYSFAEKLVSSGDAYICTCSQEAMQEGRAKGKECGCRNKSSEENMAGWKELFNAPEGKSVLRAKIDMTHQNSTMRDPTIFRVIEAEHPRTGKRYRVWPNYDFENAVMDGIYKVTHRLRTKEFEMRNELQRHLQRKLGLPETLIFEFARFNLEGVESSGRVIREMIADGRLAGWDDPRLTTLVALRRRGFLPEAIKSFVLSTGISKAEATLTWDDLIVHNKRILDKQCNRLFFIEEPVKITIKGAPKQTLRLKRHPEDPARGFRKHEAHEEFYLQKKDFVQLEEGKLYRLMDCVNFRKEADGFVFDSVEYEKYKATGAKIMHFLPADGKELQVSIQMPEGTVKEGIAESHAADLAQGDIIQFERFGFCKLDDKAKMRFWFSHG